DGDTRLDTYIDYGVPIYGLVTDDTGQTMSDVEVRLVDPVSGLSGQPVLTDESGAWSLRALDGSWDVAVEGGTARPWLPTRTMALDVDSSLEEQRLDLSYGLGEPLRATGRVVDADGQPLEDVLVRLSSAELYETDGELIAETETDGNGSFSARVVAGTYRVELVPPYVGDDGPRLLEQVWELSDHDDLGQLHLEARPIAQGVVVTPEGERVENAVVQATELGFDGYIYEARTASDGTFELPAAEGDLRWVVHPPEEVDLALSHFLLATDEVGELELVLGELVSGCVSSDNGALAYTPVDVRRGEEVLGTTTTDNVGCFAQRVQP
ncbi:MAG: carboxypeptidase regulatory-like domain-containing protein, partial [Proteobacteria bacterium]|nr:carboxypeptidase regulatory-like domain-containing protein [Pseudomonadota bacterium]